MNPELTGSELPAAGGRGPGPDRPLQASVNVAAPPGRVWSVVSDLRRTGEWSPECARILGRGQLRQRAWFVGLNHRKRVRWATVSRIVSFVPDREISWKVVTNGSVWTYRLEPTETGTRVVETRETPHGVGAVASAFTRVLLGGQRAHDDELEAGMAAGLGRIKGIVER